MNSTEFWAIVTIMQTVFRASFCPTAIYVLRSPPSIAPAAPPDCELTASALRCDDHLGSGCTQPAVAGSGLGQVAREPRDGQAESRPPNGGRITEPARALTACLKSGSKLDRDRPAP